MGIEIEVFCLQDSDFGIEELWRWVSYLDKDVHIVFNMEIFCLFLGFAEVLQIIVKIIILIENLDMPAHNQHP